MFAGIVGSIANQDQDFFVAIALFQMLECSSQSVVEGCLAVWIVSRKGSLQFRPLISKLRVCRKAEPNVFVETDFKHLILRVAGVRKRQGSLNNFPRLRAHASAVVNHQSGGDRNILMAEIFDFLRNSVFVNLKIGLAEA